MSESAAVTLLRLRAAPRLLEIEWADGTAAALSHQMLRANCPCGACRQQRRVRGSFDTSGPVAVTAIAPCGPNAVQLVFSDGHDRGIFPFRYLRELHDGAIDRGTGTGISK